MKNRRRRRGVDNVDNPENARETKRNRLPNLVGNLSTYPQERWITGGRTVYAWTITRALRCLSTGVMLAPKPFTRCPRDYPQNGAVIHGKTPVIHNYLAPPGAAEGAARPHVSP